MTKHLCKLALAAVFATSLGLHAQGFGIFSKKTVTINRLLPPTVNLKGKKIRIEAAADSVQKMGYTQVYSVDGGWRVLKDILPVE